MFMVKWHDILDLVPIAGSPPGLPQVGPGGVQAGAEDRDQVQD